MFCARTPHKYSYVAVLARLVKNSSHNRVLSKAQPGRKSEDIFPTQYRLNTLADLSKNFSGFVNHSYIFQPDPAYYFGSEFVYSFLSKAHRLMPKIFSGNIMVFMRKPIP